jgi:hypothetical protein
MHEKLTNKLTLEQLRVLAQSLPKIELDDERPFLLFRGTFYTRFPEMKAVANGYGTDEQVTYVRMTKERFGIDLVAFYSLHDELCESICSSLNAKVSYDLLSSSYQELVSEESVGHIPDGSSQSVLEAIGHPRGMEAIGLYYWDQINPLLEQAYTIFDGESLNAPFLGR